MDLTYLTKIKGILAKEYNTSIIDFDNMFFHEFNILIKQLEETREQERQEQLQKYGLVGS
ncbi:MAG: hypothetical protein M0R17_00560 [Candidatus Omnitrophica bacterium]|nr:hypothetical protein [Candidatus Omnitrophota bacterium]